jgi:hypothetical protein
MVDRKAPYAHGANWEKSHVSSDAAAADDELGRGLLVPRNGDALVTAAELELSVWRQQLYGNVLMLMRDGVECVINLSHSRLVPHWKLNETLSAWMRLFSAIVSLYDNWLRISQGEGLFGSPTAGLATSPTRGKKPH